MRNILSIARYELLRLFRDWRLIIVVLSQPIVIALLVGLIASHKPEDVKVLVYEENKNQFSESFVKALREESSLDVVQIDQFDNSDILAQNARAVVKINANQAVPYHINVEVKTDPKGSISSIVAQQAIQKAAQDLAQKIARENIDSTLQAKTDYLQQQPGLDNISNLVSFKLNNENFNVLSFNSADATDKKIAYFDYYGSSMMVVLVLLVVLNISGISITSERLSGTFERLAVTPYRKVDIIMGKMFALFLIGMAVNVLGILSLWVIYGIVLGNLWLLLLLSILVVTMAVSLGLFVSSVTKTVVESVELAMYVFFISFMTTGILLPIENAQKSFAWVEKSLPFYHAVDASRKINMMGAGWNNVRVDIGIVAGYTIIFLLLAMASLRREAR